MEDVGPGRGRWSWLLPALTFLVGLALGGLVLGGDGDPPRAAAPVPAGGEPSPPPDPGDLLVRVPEPCLRVADEAEQAVATLDRAVDAARSLDARRLQDVVDDVQRLRPRLEDLADRCRSRAGQDAGSGDTVGATPTPTG